MTGLEFDSRSSEARKTILETAHRAGRGRRDSDDDRRQVIAGIEKVVLRPVAESTKHEPPFLPRKNAVCGEKINALNDTPLH